MAVSVVQRAHRGASLSAACAQKHETKGRKAPGGTACVLKLKSSLERRLSVFVRLVGTRKTIFGAMLAAVCCGGLLQAFFLVNRALMGGFKAVDIKATSVLKEVLFGGEPWLLHCIYPSKRATAETPVRLSDLIQTNAVPLSKYVTLGTINCADTLPSGKTVLQRFRLPHQTVAFVVANRERPKAVSQWAMQSAGNLLEFVRFNTIPFVYTISNDQDFQEKCAVGPQCVVFGRRGGLPQHLRKSRISPLLEKARGLRAVHADTAKHLMKLDDALASVRPRPPQTGTREPDHTDVFCVAQTATNSTSTSGVDRPSLSPVYIGNFFKGYLNSDDQLLKFLTECRHATESSPGFVRLARLPQLSARPVHRTPPSDSGAKTESKTAEAPRHAADGENRKRGTEGREKQHRTSPQTRVSQSSPTRHLDPETSWDSRQEAAQQSDEDGDIEEIEL